MPRRYTTYKRRRQRLAVPSKGFTSRGGGKRSHSKQRRRGKQYKTMRLKSGGTHGRISSPTLNNREYPILGRLGDSPFESKVLDGPYGPQGSTMHASTHKVSSLRPGTLRSLSGGKKCGKSRRKYTRV